VCAVTFANEGRHLLTANGNGTAYVLRLQSVLTKARETGSIQYLPHFPEAEDAINGERERG